jgi:hypothetical protein
MLPNFNLLLNPPVHINKLKCNIVAFTSVATLHKKEVCAKSAAKLRIGVVDSHFAATNTFHNSLSIADCVKIIVWALLQLTKIIQNQTCVQGLLFACLWHVASLKSLDFVLAEYYLQLVR